MAEQEHGACSHPEDEKADVGAWVVQGVPPGSAGRGLPVRTVEAVLEPLSIPQSNISDPARSQIDQSVKHHAGDDGSDGEREASQRHAPEERALPVLQALISVGESE